MKKFTVTISAVVKQDVVVEATSEAEALRLVEESEGVYLETRNVYGHATRKDPGANWTVRKATADEVAEAARTESRE